MTIINTFLQRKKLRESNHGIYMVFAAYALSILLLVIGSDALYNIKSKANGMKVLSNEENQTVDIISDSYKSADLKPDIYRVEYRTDYLQKYRRDYTDIYGQSTRKAVSDDTNWLLGLAMNDEEFGRLLDYMKSNEVLKPDETESKKTIESFSAENSSGSAAISLTEEEITMLERIVEAEATGEDIIGKILVANVVLNRLADEKFPDTVKEVIFQKVGDEYQFSPVADKRYWKVKVTSETKEAVQRALNGEDYSQGALYFMARKLAKKSSIKWFDNNLKWLFKYGAHEFYK